MIKIIFELIFFNKKELLIEKWFLNIIFARKINFFYFYLLNHKQNQDQFISKKYWITYWYILHLHFSLYENKADWIRLHVMAKYIKERKSKLLLNLCKNLNKILSTKKPWKRIKFFQIYLISNFHNMWHFNVLQTIMKKVIKLLFMF